MKSGFGKTKYVALILCLMLTIQALSGIATSLAAGTATVSVNSPSCEKGQEVTVKVTVKTSIEMMMYQYTLSYDKTVLQYKSGDADVENDGSVSVVVDSASGKEQTLSFTFKSLKIGNSSMKLSGASVCPNDVSAGDLMSVTTKNGTVTVNAPYEASTNASLKSLSVGEGSLSPAFAKNTYEYSVSVSGGTDSLTVSAKAADSKATVKVSGNKSLKEGANTVSVKVTAEDGKTTKTYKIIVTRAKPSNTPTPTTGVVIPVGEQELTLSAVITADYPEGYEVGNFEYDGFTVECLNSLAGDITLVEMSNGKFFIYNAEKDSFYEYHVVSESQRTYCILEVPASEQIPEDYVATKRTIHGGDLTVYVTQEDSEYCLLYAMNWNGEKAWYQYDAKEDSMQRLMIETALTSTPTPAPTHTQAPTDKPTPSPMPTVAPDQVNDSASAGNLGATGELALICAAGVFLLLTFVFLTLFLREKNQHAESEETEHEEEYVIDESAFEAAVTKDQATSTEDHVASTEDTGEEAVNGDGINEDEK